MRAAQQAFRALEKKQAEVTAARVSQEKLMSRRGVPLPRQSAEEAEEDENDEMVGEEDEYDDDEYGEDGEEGEEGGESVAMVTRPAPRWEATALMPAEGDKPARFEKISSEDYLGKWSVLFFYPLDFTVSRQHAESCHAHFASRSLCSLHLCCCCCS